jgi:N-acetylneuraminic acid mutarotase
MLDLEDELRALLHERAETAPAAADLEARIDGRLRAKARARRVAAVAITTAVIVTAALTTDAFVARGHDGPSLHVVPGPATQPITTRAPVVVAPGAWATIADPPMTGAFASVWTGTHLVVAFRAPDLLRFASYDPAHDAWTTLPDPPVEIQAPLSDEPTFAWTGTTVLVWGYENHNPGDTSGGTHRLLELDPTTRSWRRLADPPVQSLIDVHPIWTGHELVVWGGAYGASTPAQGAAYDPVSNRWHGIATAPISIRSDPTIVWTGTEMIVWGGAVADAEGRRPLTAADQLEGAAYNPATDSWRPLPSSGLPTMQFAVGAWTGRELVVFGEPVTGTTDLGAAYDPATNRWRAIAATTLSQREQTSSTWTGHELIVWGGFFQGGPFADGAAYDPGTDRWHPLTPSPLSARFDATMGWTGQLAIVVGGSASNATSPAPPGFGAAAYRP